MDYDINIHRTREYARRHLPRPSGPLVPPDLASPRFVSRHSSLVMRFKVEDIIHNKTTDEEGQIMRIADLPGYGECYIVSVAPNPIWGTTAKEAIWKPSEVTARD